MVGKRLTRQSSQGRTTAWSASVCGVNCQNMDVLTNFWERQAAWMAKVEGIATFAAIIFIVLSVAVTEVHTPLSFVFGILGMWCFGIRMVYELWHVDEHGESKIRIAKPFVQFVFSAFTALWFIGLTFLTMVLYVKINS